MSINQITSDTKLTNIEQHFRVSAGPGAGKTFWLVEHIKNVIHNSNRLEKSKKIACITYTNIAVETILSRLGTNVEQVEVSTIHSFLYKHIIKPYISFIANEYDFNITKLDGHDEHFVSTKKIITWIQTHPYSSELAHPFNINQLITLDNNKKALVRWLGSLSFVLNPTGDISIISNRSKAYYIKPDKSRGYLNGRCLNTLEKNFINYKKLYWQEGKLHHEDVLFFSHLIINRYPFVLEVLRAQFPYFFVDEFQDSHPIQVELLKSLGQSETIVGIIGDSAQSIYSFQGANPSQIQSFALPMIIDYNISENRRSTNEIIAILNLIRTDITQTPKRNISGTQPIIIVGEMSEGLRKAKDLCSPEIIYSLSRDNITSNAMKKEIEGINLNRELINELKSIDSNKRRTTYLLACINSIELARENKFKDSLKELE